MNGQVKHTNYLSYIFVKWSVYAYGTHSSSSPREKYNRKHQNITMFLGCVMNSCLARWQEGGLGGMCGCNNNHCVISFFLFITNKNDSVVGGVCFA